MASWATSNNGRGGARVACVAMMVKATPATTATVGIKMPGIRII